MAMSQAGSCKSDLTPVWELPYATGVPPCKKNKKSEESLCDPWDTIKETTEKREGEGGRKFFQINDG